MNELDAVIEALEATLEAHDRADSMARALRMESLRSRLSTLREMRERAMEVAVMKAQVHGHVASYTVVTGTEPAPPPNLAFDHMCVLIPLTDESAG